MAHGAAFVLNNLRVPDVRPQQLPRTRGSVLLPCICCFLSKGWWWTLWDADAFYQFKISESWYFERKDWC